MTKNLDIANTFAIRATDPVHPAAGQYAIAYATLVAADQIEEALDRMTAAMRENSPFNRVTDYGAR